MSLESLRAMLQAKKQAAAEEFQGKKYVKRADIEEQRLKRLREEEEQERAAKAAKLKKQEAAGSRPGSHAAAARPDSRAAPAAPSFESLTREEVIRRLRKLKEPATLFGESDEQRFQRMLLVEAEAVHEAVEEEAVGGQQENLHIAIAREAKARKAAAAAAAEKKKAEEAEKKKKAAAVAAAAGPAAAGDAAGGGSEGGGGELAATGAGADPEKERLAAAFAAAAEAVKEAQMPVEDRIAKWLRKWMADWEEDLEARPEDVKATAAGYQADVRFKETVQYMRPLFVELKHRALDPELLAGLKLMVDAMRERNYLHANRIYLGIAIGNAAWPIGVTQVGLHERAAREKISFKGTEGKAHIMNDEATRKWIQASRRASRLWAVKRLTTFCQRRYPTDPSRSMDFDGFSNAGRGAFGAGGDKAALLTAAAAGDTLAPAPAPSIINERGAVMIPQKWSAVVRKAMEEVRQSDAKEEKEEQEQRDRAVASAAAEQQQQQQQEAAAGAQP
eukprot:scaffold29.g5915.t1